MRDLLPEHPHDARIDEEVPQLAQVEGAELLANEARCRLMTAGFTDREVAEWAPALSTSRTKVREISTRFSSGSRNKKAGHHPATMLQTERAERDMTMDINNIGAVFALELQRQLVARSEDLDARERRLNERERSLRA